jgi:hypothetical protein
MSLENVFKEVERIIEETDIALTKKRTGTNTRDSISAGLVSIARQHYKMILNSIKIHNQVNSSFALLRPLVDATYRAIWTMCASTDTQLKHIGNGSKDFLSTQELSKKIDIKRATGDTFHSRYYKNSSFLHGMTHGGLELIGRQMNKGHVKPNFSDEELVALFDEATLNYALLIHEYGKYIEDDSLMTIGGNIVQYTDLMKIYSSTKQIDTKSDTNGIP